MVFIVVLIIFGLMGAFAYWYEIRHTTPEEREKKKRLARATNLFQQGVLSLAEYDLIKSQIEGTKSMVEEFGVELTMAASNKYAADKAIEIHQQDAEKNIITNAAIGNAVGGVAGSVAFAASSAQKANVEAQELLAQQEKANAEYEAALKRSVNIK